MSIENNPDLVGKIDMLWINTKINGYPVQVLIDSGAERTIISKYMVEKCNLMHKLDTRF